LVQALHNFGDVVFLEEADGGDAGGSGGQAGMGVREGNAAEGDDWDVRFAGLAKRSEARGLGAGNVLLLENWGEDGEGCRLGGGLDYFCWGVTGDGDQRIWW
jgi:hypothetical protein